MKRLLLGLAALAALGAAAPAAGVDPDARGAAPARRRSTGCPTQRSATPCTWSTSGLPAPPTGSESSRPGSSATSPRWKRGGARRTPLVRPGSTSSRSPARARSEQLDITNVALTQPISGDQPRVHRRSGCSSPLAGFNQPEKIYLVYYDGPTGQTGREQICGQGAPPRAPRLRASPSSTSTRAARPRPTRCARSSASTSSSTSSAPSTTVRPTSATTATSATSSPT